MTGAIHKQESIDWIGFDLDNTLHNYRDAACVAMEVVYTPLTEYTGTTRDTLRRRYSQILAQDTADAFSSGYSSEHYRRARFAKLANHSANAPLIDDLLHMYAAALQHSLTVDPEAPIVLSVLRHLGYRIAVISEGPHDAQRWTLEQLELDSLVDKLFTSGHERLSKTDGLFTRVLDQLEIGSSNLLYVGDSYERDIQPARSLDIPTVWLTPNADTSQPLRYEMAISRLSEVVPLAIRCCARATQPNRPEIPTDRASAP